MRVFWLAMVVGCGAVPDDPGTVGFATTATPTPTPTATPSPTPAAEDTETDSDGSMDSDLPVPTVRCAGLTPGTELGECAPDFTLMDVGGVDRSLYDVGDVITVVDFSTMWCPHCRNLAPVLESLHADYGTLDVAVITVIHENVSGQPPTAADLQAWIDAYDITHTVLRDPGGRVEATHGSHYQPNVLVLDAEGVVRWRQSGGSAASGVRAAVEALR